MAYKRRPSVPGTRRSSRKRKPVSQNSTTKSPTTTFPLCKTCCGFDLNRMFRPTVRDTDLPLKVFGDYEEVTVGVPSFKDPCTFCDFLRSLSDYSLWKDEHENIPVHIWDLGETHFPLLKSSGATLFGATTQNGFKGYRYFAAQAESMRPVRIVERDSIDYSVVHEWLRLCQQLHPDGCNPTVVNVPGLKLIDCKTRTIVSASNHEYVTLSYVWGNGENGVPFTGQLPAELPETIADSLSVTQQLGFRYLWIDRYCINQSNTSETSAQLRVMGSIYRNSQLTIIAAAGHSPSYGLPGVGNRSRHQQAHTQMNQGYLREIWNIEEVVSSSRWSNRGWTYQEGILATRRLIFTDSQVYFECQGMNNYETFDLPYAGMHSPTLCPQIDSCFHSYPPGHYSPRVGLFPGSNGSNVFDQISDFSSRELSHPSDRLRAFLGIFEAFEKGSHRLRHFWGIPILLETFPTVGPKIITLDSGYNSKSSMTSEGIQEYSVSSFVLSLLWNHYETGLYVRIEKLPSWSWAGVQRGVYFDHRIESGLNYNDEKKCQIFDVEIAIECLNEDVVSWRKYHEHYEVLREGTLSQYIHIKAWSAMAEIGPPNPISNNPHWKLHTLSISMTDGSVVNHKIYLPIPYSQEPSVASHSTGDSNSSSMPDLNPQATIDIGTDVATKQEVLILILGQLDGQLMILVTSKTDTCDKRGVETWERVHSLFAGRREWNNSGGFPKRWVLNRAGHGEGNGDWDDVKDEGETGGLNLDEEEILEDYEPELKRRFGDEWWRSMKGCERRKIKLG